jgi:T-complex protein 1 subunit gamma
VITEKGISDLAAHFLVKANISALRRVRKTDNNRISRATGATIVHDMDDLKESDVGTQCGLFHVDKLGDEYFSYLVDCKDPKACTVVLRGASKDVLNEVERNLQDAMSVARNVMFDHRLVPGGGAAELAMAQALYVKARSIEGVQQWPYRAVAEALEVIPRTLAQNCGANTIRVMTELRAIHARGESYVGVDGILGVCADMRTVGILEPLTVKAQTLKTAIDAACLLLRVDDIVSGIKRRKDADAPGAQQGGAPEGADPREG